MKVGHYNEFIYLHKLIKHSNYQQHPDLQQVTALIEFTKNVVQPIKSEEDLK